MTTAIATTVIIQINPTVDPKYQDVKREIELYAQCMADAVIDSPEAVRRITADVNLGAKLGKQVETLRLAYKEDITRYGKEIDAAFKPLSTPIAEARDVAAKKIRVFNDEQREKQRLIDAENSRIAREAAEMQALIDAENERIKKEADPETGEISEDLIAPEPAPKFIPMAPVVQKASTDFGSASEKMVPKVKLIDLSQVPIEYHIFNEKAVVEMAKVALRNKMPLPKIAGLDITAEPEVSFRSK